MSHLFHGLLINLIRRSDCQSAQPINPSEAENGHGDLEVVWHEWAQAEMKKRCVKKALLLTAIYPKNETHDRC